MTKEELICKHIPLVDYVQGKMTETQRQNATQCAHISIEYAISVLEELWNDKEVFSDGRDEIALPISVIREKITELHNLIK